MFINDFFVKFRNVKPFCVVWNGAFFTIFEILVTNDRSEARVDPLAALLVQGGGQTGKYQAVVSRAT